MTARNKIKMLTVFGITMMLIAFVSTQERALPLIILAFTSYLIIIGIQEAEKRRKRSNVDTNDPDTLELSD